ncbi:uncharacterized protein LOC135225072 [Macrobrachium nipponense]|uniref:uncharacterized protein LOC135225072 n=1 Tax=Macrobrachium nipponense TaxID=159736 RepID=UPI0030C83CE9
MEDKAAVAIAPAPAAAAAPAPAPVALEDEYPPGEEPPAKGSGNVKDTKKETSGAAEEDEEPPPPGVDLEEHKKQSRDDTDNLDELTEQKKNSSLGAVLSVLSTGSFGSKAKENIVKVEVSGPRKRYHNDKLGPQQEVGGGGRGGVASSTVDGYEEEEADEDDTSANEAWIAEETKLLEEEFGPGIISIMYDDDGGMIGSSTIPPSPVPSSCTSDPNAITSLEAKSDGKFELLVNSMAQLDLSVPVEWPKVSRCTHQWNEASEGNFLVVLCNCIQGQTLFYMALGLGELPPG